MRARIYQPAKTAMQSGTAKTTDWILEFGQDEAQEVDPLMGWTGSSDTQAQVRLRFDTQEDAMAYAAEKGWDYDLAQPQTRKPNIRARGYGENFATDRKTVWTH